MTIRDGFRFVSIVKVAGELTDSTGATKGLKS
jgi:hypothetical protein